MRRLSRSLPTLIAILGTLALYRTVWNISTCRTLCGLNARSSMLRNPSLLQIIATNIVTIRCFVPQAPERRLLCQLSLIDRACLRVSALKCMSKEMMHSMVMEQDAA